MALKILAFSDIHADEGALQGLQEIFSRNDYDLVICAGDLSNRGPISFVQQLLDIFGEKFYFVHGNMDSTPVLDLLRKYPNYLHGRKINLGEWNLVGLGGSNPTPFSTPSELSETQIAHILKNSNVDSHTILVSHPPPKGIFDGVRGEINAGSSAVRECMDKNKPLILLCGHIHENEGKKIVGDTLVIKLGAAEARRAAQIEIGDEIKAEFLTF
ncbi:metallophosphoesterase [Candidatus Micrarchaeota archaeon CG10_big_fil_rev_8_21_14_0_10_45_29]|nr:MAG: metallophosphoesterase [Candidatus Micrarchaeota archaeon CG10_big_fil_rev_8_21_14_0_10_45_29]